MAEPVYDGTAGQPEQHTMGPGGPGRQIESPPPHVHHGSHHRMEGYPGYENDHLVMRATDDAARVSVTLRWTRDDRAWLRRWLDHMDREGRRDGG